MTRARLHDSFFFNNTATTEIYTLSLHDALPISEAKPLLPILGYRMKESCGPNAALETSNADRSEEHTSELQSQFHLVCRLLLEKKKKDRSTNRSTSASNGVQRVTPGEVKRANMN